MALITPDTVPIALIFQLFANLPFAWITLACYVTASLHVPQRDLGLALGLIRIFRFLGGAVGTTMFAEILGNKATISIPTRVGEALTPLNYPADKWDALITAISTRTTATLVNTPANIIAAADRAVQLGYGDAFKITWLAAILLASLPVLSPSSSVIHCFTSPSTLRSRFEKQCLGGKIIEASYKKELEERSV